MTNSLKYGLLIGLAILVIGLCWLALAWAQTGAAQNPEVVKWAYMAAAIAAGLGVLGAGVAVAAANGLAAWLLIRWAFERDNQIFVLAVLGGMGVRLALVVAVSVAVFKFTQLPAGAYLGGLIVAFLVFQVLEIALLLRRRTRAKRGQGEPR